MLEGQTPIVRAVYLLMLAMNGGSTGDGIIWRCCNANGTISETLNETEGYMMLRKDGEKALPLLEMYYCMDGSSSGDIVKVKWVYMDDTHIVMILQRRSGTDASSKPITVSLCTKEEPLVSNLHTAREWSEESIEAAAKQLRPALYDMIADRCDHACDSNNSKKSTNSIGSGNGGGGDDDTNTMGASKLRQEINRHPECTPNLPSHANPSPHDITAAPSMFAGVEPRPPGFRYGEGDLAPGGSLPWHGGISGAAGGGGMLLDKSAFQGSGASMHARYDPMFPGDVPQGGGSLLGPGPGRVFLGEPDPDNFAPPGGPAFGLGFGPRPARGGGGAGGGGWSSFF